MIHELAAMARKHWAEWLPRKTARLKAAGTFTSETQKAAVRAADGIQNWMSAGAQPHEAREIVLPEYILLNPESNAVETPEQRTENDAAEREYQDMMRPINETPEITRARMDLEAALDELAELLPQGRGGLPVTSNK